MQITCKNEMEFTKALETAQGQILLTDEPYALQSERERERNWKSLAETNFSSAAYLTLTLIFMAEFGSIYGENKLESCEHFILALHISFFLNYAENILNQTTDEEQ